MSRRKPSSKGRGQEHGTKSTPIIEQTEAQVNRASPQERLDYPPSASSASTRHSGSNPSHSGEAQPFLSNPGFSTPEVTHFEPHSGIPGSLITVWLRSRQPIEFYPGPRPTLVFAGYRMPSQLFGQGQNGAFHEYAMTGHVPMLATESSPAECPIYLTFNDATQNTIHPISVGSFEYWQRMEYQNLTPTQAAPRKRRVSSTSTVPTMSSIKRVASQNFSPPSMEPPEFPMPNHSYSASMSPETFSHTYDGRQLPYSQPFVEPTYGTGYDWSSNYASYEAPGQIQTVFDPDPSTLQSHYTTSPESFSYSRGFEGTTTATAGPRGSNSPVNLIRTSFLRQSSSRPKLSTHSSFQQFNPYSIPKATLEVNGDLNSVLENWTSEERKARRRIVEFDREQTGSVISASFNVVSRDEWDSAKISVNCIWWQERNEGFITSVDLINLLESIMALRFTLQEKNRIRRNLEGFRPLTIGKSKPDKEPLADDVEAFFKVIMSLDEPRPRSIEKDVKVFPWSSLTPALKKVVDKYSASYASTAGAMTPGSTSSGTFEDSPIRRHTPMLQATPTMSNYALSGTDAESPASSQTSTYSSGLATTQPVTTFSESLAFSGAGFAQHDESLWHGAAVQESAYHFAPASASESYQVPNFSAPYPGHVPMRSHTLADRTRHQYPAATYPEEGSH